MTTYTQEGFTRPSGYFLSPEEYNYVSQIPGIATKWVTVTGSPSAEHPTGKWQRYEITLPDQRVFRIDNIPNDPYLKYKDLSGKWVLPSINEDYSQVLETTADGRPEYKYVNTRYYNPDNPNEFLKSIFAYQKYGASSQLSWDNPVIQEKLSRYYGLVEKEKANPTDWSGYKTQYEILQDQKAEQARIKAEQDARREARDAARAEADRQANALINSGATDFVLIDKKANGRIDVKPYDKPYTETITTPITNLIPTANVVDNVGQQLLPNASMTLVKDVGKEDVKISITSPFGEETLTGSKNSGLQNVNLGSLGIDLGKQIQSSFQEQQKQQSLFTSAKEEAVLVYENPSLVAMQTEFNKQNAAATEPKENLNLVQKGIDKIQNLVKEESSKGAAGLFVSGAIIGFTEPIKHPIEAVKGIGYSILHPVKTVKELGTSLKTDTASTLGQLAGGFLLGEIGGAAVGVAGKGVKPIFKTGLKVDTTGYISGTSRIAGDNLIVDFSKQAAGFEARKTVLGFPVGKSRTIIAEGYSVSKTTPALAENTFFRTSTGRYITKIEGDTKALSKISLESKGKVVVSDSKAMSFDLNRITTDVKGKTTTSNTINLNKNLIIEESPLITTKDTGLILTGKGKQSIYDFKTKGVNTGLTQEVSRQFIELENPSETLTVSKFKSSGVGTENAKFIKSLEQDNQFSIYNDPRYKQSLKNFQENIKSGKPLNNEDVLLLEQKKVPLKSQNEFIESAKKSVITSLEKPSKPLTIPFGVSGSSFAVATSKYSMSKINNMFNTPTTYTRTTSPKITSIYPKFDSISTTRIKPYQKTSISNVSATSLLGNYSYKVNTKDQVTSITPKISSNSYSPLLVQQTNTYSPISNNFTSITPIVDTKPITTPSIITTPIVDTNTRYDDVTITKPIIDTTPKYDSAVKLSAVAIPKNTSRMSPITPSFMSVMPSTYIPKKKKKSGFDLDFGDGRRKFGKKKSKYAPSVEAIVFNIKSSKKPRMITGLELRPL